VATHRHRSNTISRKSALVRTFCSTTGTRRVRRTTKRSLPGHDGECAAAVGLAPLAARAQVPEIRVAVPKQVRGVRFGWSRKSPRAGRARRLLSEAEQQSTR
jgi:hypothetical protein